MNESYKIFVINPGSTSTKVAFFENGTERCSETLEHFADEIRKYNTLMDQYEMRKSAILGYLDKIGVMPQEITAIAARGGGFGPMKAGAYVVDEDLYKACQTVPTHVSMLATIISYEMVRQYGIKAYIYDAITSDEMDGYAKISGLPEIERRAAGHVLNSKAVARREASNLEKKYDECAFIVSHLGGGCTTTLHKNGRIVDIVSADNGTFTPERAGGLPVRALVKFCYSGKYTETEMIKKLFGKAGLIAYLGTSDARQVEARIASGDEYAKSVYYAMAYQIAKDIGSLAAAAAGKIDGIIVTGGLAHSEMLTKWIKELIGFIAPIKIIPGAIEMEALANGILRVLRGEEEAYLIGNKVGK